MVIYSIIKDYGDIKIGTKFLFNKSKQRFETFSRKNWITNDESYHNPGLIIIHQTLTKKSETKKVWVIPFIFLLFFII